MLVMSSARAYFIFVLVELISLWCLNYVPPATGSSTVDVTKHLTVSLVTKLICINLYFDCQVQVQFIAKVDKMRKTAIQPNMFCSNFSLFNKKFKASRSDFVESSIYFLKDSRFLGCSFSKLPLSVNFQFPLDSDL